LVGLSRVQRLALSGLAGVQAGNIDPGTSLGSEREGILVKRRIVVIGVLAATIGLMSGTASAGQKPVGGCPNSYDLVKAKGEKALADLNGDGWVCITPIPANPPGSINVIDNNTPQ
jgi:hypothetical protein